MPTHANSCAEILRRFFRDNPDEWLTEEDLLVKVGRGSLSYQTLADLREALGLEIVKVYRVRQIEG